MWKVAKCCLCHVAFEIDHGKISKKNLDNQFSAEFENGTPCFIWQYLWLCTYNNWECEA